MSPNFVSAQNVMLNSNGLYALAFCTMCFSMALRMPFGMRISSFAYAHATLLAPCGSHLLISLSIARSNSSQNASSPCRCRPLSKYPHAHAICATARALVSHSPSFSSIPRVSNTCSAEAGWSTSTIAASSRSGTNNEVRRARRKRRYEPRGAVVATSWTGESFRKLH